MVMVMVNLHAKFQIPSYTHSKDMMDPKIKKGHIMSSHDYLTKSPFLGWSVIRYLVLAMVILCARLEVSSFNHCSDWKGK